MPADELLALGMQPAVTAAVHAARRALDAHQRQAGGAPAPPLRGPFLLEFMTFLADCDAIPRSVLPACSAVQAGAVAGGEGCGLGMVS